MTTLLPSNRAPIQVVADGVGDPIDRGGRLIPTGHEELALYRFQGGSQDPSISETRNFMRIAASGQEQKKNKSIFIVINQIDTALFALSARAFGGGADFPAPGGAPLWIGGASP